MTKNIILSFLLISATAGFEVSKSNMTIPTETYHDNSNHLDFSAMIPVLVLIELICFSLLGLLFYLANNALNQYKAE